MKNAVIQAPGKRGAVKPKDSNEVRSKAEAFLGSLQATGFRADESVRQFCDTYAVTQDTFTRLTGFSPRAVANWMEGRKPSASTQRRLTELKRLFSTLERLVDKEAIGPWLKEPNLAFDGSTPLQVIERGESDRLWRMIHELESGEPN
ncbi:MAG: DUF2384 domain-containing protein [Verrucomicrobia bacterium]|nr:DUF2384 domain-containing protein [Verrucomicrobiota bacterium]